LAFSPPDRDPVRVLEEVRAFLLQHLSRLRHFFPHRARGSAFLYKGVFVFSLRPVLSGTGIGASAVTFRTIFQRPRS